MLIKTELNKNHLLHTAYTNGNFDEFKKHIESGENINRLCSNGNSLIVQIIDNYESIDEELNKKFFDLMLASNVHLGETGSARHIKNLLCCDSTDIYYLEEILKKTNDVNFSTERINHDSIYGSKPIIHEVIGYGDIDKINLVLQYYKNLDEIKYPIGDLLCTLMMRNKSVIKEILPSIMSLGADPCDVEKWFYTAIHIAIEYSLGNDVVEMLAKNTKKIDFATDIGHTALSYAAFENNSEAIEILLKLKADINYKDKYGMTPIIIAARTKKSNALKTLIKNNADITITDNEGKNFLHHIAASLLIKDDSKESIDILKKYKKTLLLKKDIYGMTPIDIIKKSQTNIYDENNESYEI